MGFHNGLGEQGSLVIWFKVVGGRLGFRVLGGLYGIPREISWKYTVGVQFCGSLDECVSLI